MTNEQQEAIKVLIIYEVSDIQLLICCPPVPITSKCEGNKGKTTPAFPKATNRGSSQVTHLNQALGRQSEEWKYSVGLLGLEEILIILWQQGQKSTFSKSGTEWSQI